MTSESQLGLGTVQWGMPYGVANETGRPSSDEISDVLAIAAQAGVRWLDTASAYGESEATIGVVAAEDRWRIVTKIAPDAAAAHGRSAERVSTSLRRSHERLRRHILDVVLMHRAEDRTGDAGAGWRTLVGARDAGTVGVAGVSVATVEDALDALDDADVGALQVPCSLLDARFATSGLLDAARRAGVSVHVRSVFLQGAALMDPRRLPPHLAPLAGVLDAIADHERVEGRPRGSTFTRWARSLPVSVVLFGCERPAQLREILDAWALGPLEADERGHVEALAAGLPLEVLDPRTWPTRS